MIELGGQSRKIAHADIRELLLTPEFSAWLFSFLTPVLLQRSLLFALPSFIFNSPLPSLYSLSPLFIPCPLSTIHPLPSRLFHRPSSPPAARRLNEEGGVAAATKGCDSSQRGVALDGPFI